MSVLKIKDNNGNWISVPAMKGTSPEISVQNITGGHRVTITDDSHPQGQSFDVMDGEDAQTGTPVSLTFTYEDDTTVTYNLLTLPSNS